MKVEELGYSKREANKRAIIMGATSGLGKGVALGLLKEGYIIGIGGRRSEELDNIKALAPDKIFTKVIDITTNNAPSLLLELINEMGGIDLYFHSSGYGKQNESLDIEIEKQTVLTNTYGFTQMVDTAFNYFKTVIQQEQDKVCSNSAEREQTQPKAKTSVKSGRIAIISSVAGTKGLGASPSYSATKRFDWTYIEALAQLAHMQNLDIKFTDIRPGFVSTDFIAGSNFPLQMTTEYAVKHILKAVLSGKRKAIIDWKYKIICFFWKVLPSCIWERMKITSH